MQFLGRGVVGEIDEGRIVHVVGNAEMLEMAKDVAVREVARGLGFPKIVGFQAVFILEIGVVFFDFG